MKIDRRWMAACLALTVAACGGDARAGDAGGTGNAASEGEEVFTRVINVQTRTVEPRDWIERIALSGTVEANRDVIVAAEESGVIRETFVEKGSRVRADQPIARIDDRILRSQVDQARAQAELARETWERRKRLWEEDRVGTELAYLEARYGAQQAAANLAVLEERLDRTVIRAPFAGVLDSRFVEVGTMVSPGSRVARVLDLDPVKITGGVPERYAPDVGVGAPVQVTFDVLGDRPLEGTISYVGAAVDERNRTFPVEFELPNPGGVIKPQMVADVSVVRRSFEDAVVVPQEALVRVEDGFVVFVVEGEGEELTARSREVTVGPTQRNEAVIEEGLEPGDRLVVVGQQQVASGDRVRIVKGGR